MGPVGKYAVLTDRECRFILDAVMSKVAEMLFRCGVRTSKGNVDAAVGLITAKGGQILYTKMDAQRAPFASVGVRK